MSDYLGGQRQGSGALAATTGRAVAAAVCVGLLFVTVWGLEIVDWILPGEPLDQFGIHARDVSSLPFILTAPFLHYGFDHLIANSLPLLVLGFLAAMAGIGRFGATTMIIIAVSGVGVWLTAAPNSITLGASGLIFGYFGYLIGRGVFERRTVDIVVAAVVVVLYGTMIFGALPLQQQGISWQGHLFGLIGGVIAAWVLRRPRMAGHGAPHPGSGFGGPPGHPGGTGGYPGAGSPGAGSPF